MRLAGPAAAVSIAAVVRRQALLWLTAAVLLPATTAVACEKHLNGHQNSSQTAAEVSR